jgi:hypothetical protein
MTPGRTMTTAAPPGRSSPPADGDDVARAWPVASNRLLLSRSADRPVSALTSTGAVVETMGLEPTTPCLQSRCSSQLSYVPG